MSKHWRYLSRLWIDGPEEVDSSIEAYGLMDLKRWTAVLRQTTLLFQDTQDRMAFGSNIAPAHNISWRYERSPMVDVTWKEKNKYSACK